MKNIKIILTLVFGLMAMSSFGQVILTNASPSTTIDFSASMQATVGNGAFTAAGFQAMPTTGQLNSNAWAVTGWNDGPLAYAGTRITASTDYTRGSVSVAVTTGGFYAYTGTPQSVANPCLMIQPGGSDFAPGTLTLRIQNNGTTNITDLAISYNLFVRNDQARSTSFNFSHSSDDTTYTAVGALDYTSTAALDALGWVQVGASPSRTTTITGLSIAPLSFYYIRWSSDDVAGTGSRDELGLDDISLTATYASSCTAPTLSATTSATAILTTSTTLNGTVTAVGGGTNVTTRGFEYATNANLATPTSLSTLGTFGATAFNQSTGAVLTANTLYYYRAFATNDCASPQTGYSHTSSFPTFTTVHNAPTIGVGTAPTSAGFTANWTAPTGGSAAFSYTIEVDDNIDFSSITATLTGISSASISQIITGLASTTTYYYRIKAVNASGDSAWSATSAAIMTLAPAPEINVKQGATSIAHAGSQAFANTAIGATTDLVFTIENTGSTNLTFTTPLSISGTDYTLIAPFAASPVTAGGTTTFTVRFTPSATGNRSGSVTINGTNDSDEPTYSINFTGSGIPNTASTLTTDTTYGYSSNIAYANFQATPVPASASNSVGVHNIIITDGADADVLPTILTGITFTYTGTANTIRSAALFTTTGSKVAEATTVAANTLTFTGMSGTNSTALDGATAQLILRVTYGTTVTDNEKLVFTVSSATAAGSNTSSFFTSFAAVSDAITSNDRNRIEVTADRMLFVQNASNVVVNGIMATVTVSANDVNGNRDLDFTTSTTISSNGTLTGSPVSGVVSNGLITFSGLVHTVAQTGRQLTVASSGLLFNSSLSTTFDITDIANGTYRTLTAGTWPTPVTATWERLSAGNWISGTPASNTTDLIIIRHTITTNGSISVGKIIVANAGTLTYSASSTCGTSMLIELGGTLQINAALTMNGTFTVQSGGRVNLNSSTTDGDSNLWNGTEDFQDGSTFDIQGWNFSTNRLIQNPSNISTNTTSGNYFGNLIISCNPSSLFVVVNGSQTVNLCKNNFTVSENGTNNVALTNSGANVTIGGDVIVTAGQLSIAATTTGDPITTILGNISPTAGIINLNQNSSSNATSTIQLKGNLSIPSGVTLSSSDPGCSIVFSKAGTQTISLAGTLGTNVAFEVGATSTTQLINQNLTLSNPSNKLTVLTNGTLEFNYLDILGSGDFIQETQGVLKITSADGVNASGATGNVRNTGTRTFSQTGAYHFVGNVTPQSTGTAMTSGSTSKRIVVDKTNATDIVNLTQSTGTTNELYIIKGVFVETEALNINGSGNLTMDTDGKYITSVTSATTPKLSGTYSLNDASTIELNAAGNQELRGSRAYRNLIFSSSGTKTISSAISSITGTITVANAAILDVDNKTMGGSGTNLTMTGTSQYSTAGTGVKPDASGTYALGTGTKVTFKSGSIAVPIATLQQIRLAPSYYNIDVVGNNVGTNTLTSSINMQAGGTFTVKATGIFKHANTAGFSGVANAALSMTNTPTITLESGSTIDYAGDNQSVTLFSPYYRNLTISGTGEKTLLSDTQTRVEEDLNVVSGTLKIGSTKALTVKQAVKITPTTGVFEIENNGQLIQIDETDANTGTGANFKVNRIAQAKNSDYVYWSAPTDNFDVVNIPDNNRYFWNPIFANSNGTQGNWRPATGNMVKGQGYIARISNGSATPVATPVLFQGQKPHNGQFDFGISRGSVTGTNDCWNLVGNPYPSALDADQFLAANTTIEGSVRIWTHGTAPAAIASPFYDSFQYNYTADDYITYNGTATTTPAVFNGKIASGQGFFVRMLDTGEAGASASSTSNITFKNAFRRATDTSILNNTEFFRNATSETTPIEKSRIWLDLIAPNNQIANTVVGYVPGATVGKDRLYDALAEVNSFGFYSLIASQKQLIQGRPLPFDVNDMVPMGVFIQTAGTYTIAISAVDGLFSAVSQNIYLEDTLLNIIHNLKQAPYVFSTTAGEINSRFVLRYTTQSLGNTDVNYANQVAITSNNSQITIQSITENIAQVYVFDLLGREVYFINKINTLDVAVGTNLKNQVLLVKVKLQNGVVVSKKIVVK